MPAALSSRDGLASGRRDLSRYANDEDLKWKLMKRDFDSSNDENMNGQKLDNDDSPLLVAPADPLELDSDDGTEQNTVDDDDAAAAVWKVMVSACRCKAGVFEGTIREHISMFGDCLQNSIGSRQRQQSH